MDTDFVWLDQHKRLLQRALESQGSVGDKSLILRSSDLRAVEEWLARAGAPDECRSTTSPALRSIEHSYAIARCFHTWPTALKRCLSCWRRLRSAKTERFAMAETGIAATQVQSKTDFDYPARRVDGQAAWHSAKATWNKRRYYTFEIATLLAGALIPIVNVWAGEDSTAVRVWSAILGGVVVLAAGVSKLFKFQENWLQYRGIAEALTRERELFTAKAGDYQGEDETKRRTLLVERAETLLANVTAQFIATHRSQPKADSSSSERGT